MRESLTRDDVTFINEGLKILTNAQSLQPLGMPHLLQSGAAVWIVDLLCDSCQGFVSRISTSSSSHFIRDSASMRGGRCKSVLYYAISFKWCFAKNNYFFHFSSLKYWPSTYCCLWCQTWRNECQYSGKSINNIIWFIYSVQGDVNIC